jgi:hypothetical protein
MTTPNEPLWLAIERQIKELGSQDLSEGTLEANIQQVASALDATGLNVSKNAGGMLAVRGAMAARAEVGRPLMGDLDRALKALTLEDVVQPYGATVKLIEEVGADWPALKKADRRSQILTIVEGIRLDLLIARAQELGGDQGIRFLIEEEVAPETIVERMEIGREVYDRVLAEVEAERAEVARVQELIGAAEGKAEPDLIRHLLTSDVADDLIVELAGVEMAAVADVKKAMEEEIAEKKRLAEEAAAKKAAEAAGPALEDLDADDMLEHIEAIREIMDFSDVEKEIRAMCEQSSVPQALVDIAIEDPDRLDELEAEAEG